MRSVGRNGGTCLEVAAKTGRERRKPELRVSPEAEEGAYEGDQQIDEPELSDGGY